MSKAVLLYNPAAGRLPLSRKRLTVLVEQLHGLGLQVEPVCSQPRGSRVNPIDLEGRDMLIIYGGDGTIHDGLPAAIQWDVPVALLPAGTANVLARELRIPRNPQRALRILAAGNKRRIYLGRTETRYFHLMAGIGLDSYVIRQTNARLKRTFGVGSYWLSGLQSFWTVPIRPFEILLDGESRQATFAVVSNCRFYGGHLLVAPQATVFEDCLDVCLFTSTDRIRYLKYLYGVMSGAHIRYPDVVYRKAQSVEVLGDGSIPVQLDGDVAGHAPMKFQTFSPGVQVFVPRGE